MVNESKKTRTLSVLHWLTLFITANGCEDVTIVGAGISGTYAAWRLKDSNLKIGVYEYSERVGGRMFTRRFAEAPDLNIELGAMRLIPGTHRRMINAIGDLGLKVPGYSIHNLKYVQCISTNHNKNASVNYSLFAYLFGIVVWSHDISHYTFAKNHNTKSLKSFSKNVDNFLWEK